MLSSSSSGSSPSSSPFTTTSDVLRQLNAALDRLDDDDDDAQEEVGNGSDAARTASSSAPPRFELQRKFEDGSTRKATEAELKSRDFEGKLKQTALHLSTLTSPLERERFVQDHIEYGNQLYASQQYEDAMDVYLTCLTGVNMSSNTSNNNNNNDTGRDSEATEGGGVKAVLLVRILHNLALSALKLGWHKKCLRFSAMGLRALGLDGSSTSDDACGVEDDNMEGSSSTTKMLDGVARADDASAARKLFAAKLYHVHAKASRLTGRYTDAQSNISEALRWINDGNIDHTRDGGVDDKRNDGTTKTTNKAAQLVAVRKEQRLLRDAMQRGRDNRIRQRVAMQMILSNPGASVSSKTTGDDSRLASSSTPIPLYDDDSRIKDKGGGSSLRQYSNLRSPSYYAAARRRSRASVTEDKDDEECMTWTSSTSGITTTRPRRRTDGCCQRVFTMVRSYVHEAVGATTTKDRAEAKRHN